MAWNPTLKLNVYDIFNRAYAGDSRELRDKVRPVLKLDSVKTTFGQFVIDRIVERTQDQRIDKTGRPFKGYSKAYAESTEGQVYGKRAGETADLTATGDMLTDMRVDKITSTEVIIRFGEQENRDKAQGHISGKLGNSKKNYKRDFFGLPQEELTKIMRETVQIARQSSFDILAELTDISSETGVPFNIEQPEEDDG